ncbi:MAG: DUF167 domain-containing protein [Candidatus Uhrbacteria bacterium]|nr:DUF167 domain-containing protein [Candidatus Uhrbacteria bacterium]
MIITVHVKPRSRQNKIEWIDEETVKISVTAIAEKGKANDAVIEVLSNDLDIAKSRIEIVRGKTTRIKQVEINNVTRE